MVLCALLLKSKHLTNSHQVAVAVRSHQTIVEEEGGRPFVQMEEVAALQRPVVVAYLLRTLAETAAAFLRTMSALVVVAFHLRISAVLAVAAFRLGTLAVAAAFLHHMAVVAYLHSLVAAVFRRTDLPSFHSGYLILPMHREQLSLHLSSPSSPKILSGISNSREIAFRLLRRWRFQRDCRV